MTTLLSSNALAGAPSSASLDIAPAIPPTAELRVALRRPGGLETFVDGGWWPYSLDLVSELPPLLSAVEAAGYFEIRRVTYALTAWNGLQPRKCAMLNRIVKLGGFRYQDPAEIVLVDSGGWKRVTLVVVPPSAPDALAQHALSLAGMDGDRHRAREILDLAARPTHMHSIGSACVDELAASTWDSEGGRARR